MDQLFISLNFLKKNSKSRYKKRKAVLLQELSLKQFKKQQCKNKAQTLFLKNKRQTKSYLFNISLKKGQIIIETLFIFISLVTFLLAIQFFHSFAKEKIQKQRLTKKNYKNKKPKSPWYRNKNQL